MNEMNEIIYLSPDQRAEIAAAEAERLARLDEIDARCADLDAYADSIAHHDSWWRDRSRGLPRGKAVTLQEVVDRGLDGIAVYECTWCGTLTRRAGPHCGGGAQPGAPMRPRTPAARAANRLLGGLVIG